MSTATCSNAAPERFEKHVNARLVWCRPDQLLESLKERFPTECEHSLALYHAWALFGFAIQATACRGRSKLDSNGTEDVDKVVSESADGLNHDALDL